MEYNQLRSVAKHKGFVRWRRSGLVKRLRLARDSRLLVVAEIMEVRKQTVPLIVLAKNLITGQEHPIQPFPGQTDFECCEISPQTPVRVGDLLPKG